MSSLARFLLIGSLVCAGHDLVPRVDGAEPVRRDLVVLYDFQDTAGLIVRDRSGVGRPLDLKIDAKRGFERRRGAIRLDGSVRIHSAGPATKLIEAVKKSSALTIETWIRPRDRIQSGPARIVSLSIDPYQRNFTLGQEGDHFDVRFRTSATSDNGQPSTASPKGSARAARTHVVYTRDRKGAARLYVDGRLVAQARVGGSLANWRDDCPLILANEKTGDRPWLGELYQVAVYSAALSAEDVARNFAAGGGGKRPPVVVAPQVPPKPTTVPDPTFVTSPPSTGAKRVGRGLQVFYDFASPTGAVVRDRSGAGAPVHLRITEPKSVRRTAGALEVRGDTLIRSDQSATRLTEAIRRSARITLEAWIRPARTDLVGPARIVTLSADTSRRNFTLGQEADRYDVRFRATGTSENGIPSLASLARSLAPKLAHVAYTRDRAGRARIYINGKQSADRMAPGATSNWDRSFRLALANELTGDRPWRGTYYLVAIYNRDLSPQEIGQNFRAGAGAQAGPVVAGLSPAEELFETRIAPLLADRCLDCHDSSTRKGRLDLSRKARALAGGENGPVIVPGKAAKSLLWEAVESDEMPKKRSPLSPENKKLLRQWLDAGAPWSLDVIDPAVYAHGDRTGGVWVQRLTIPQYIQTVRSVVGVDIAAEARHLIPPDLRADGFSNTAYNLNVDLKHVEAYARLAEIIVSRMDPAKFAARFSRSRKLTDDDMRKLIAGMGKWLLRGPLTEEEIVTYRGVSTTAASAGSDFSEAVGYVVQAMLQSPRFVYRMENQQGDGTAWPVGEYELASRLSYIIWGGPPDTDLYRSAEAGELSDSTHLAAQVQRMLGDRRAVEQSRRFLSEWLDLARLDNLRPNRKRFPKWNTQLASDMQAETLIFFEEVVWKQKRPLGDLLNAQVTFLTPKLAEHYGLPPRGSGRSSYDLSKVPARGGLLTQGSVLTIGGDEASMVTRGLFVLRDLLRGVVKDPPPCVDTTPKPTKPGLTQRSVAEQRVADRSCGGCHIRFEPLAFGLEKFDGLGAYRERDEHGNRLREDGQVLFPGEAKPVAFRSSAQLMDLLARSDRVRRSITWKLTQFALGRPLGGADARIVDKIHRVAEKNGGTYTSLITAIVTSDLVRMTRTEAAP